MVNRTAPKIVHIQLLPLLTGVQRVTLEELRRLPAEYEKYLICRETGPLTEACEEINTKCYTVPQLKRNINPIEDLKAFWLIYKKLRNINPDIVHTHSSKTGLLGRLAARMAGVPFVVHTVHGFAWPATRNPLVKIVYVAMEWIAARCCHCLIVLNSTDLAIATGSLQKSPGTVKLLPNGIDLDTYKPANTVDRKTSRNELGIGSDVVLVGMVGRLWEQKNPELLLESCLALFEQGLENFELLYVGDGELRKSLEDTVERSSFSKKIHFLGWRDDIPRLLCSLDIFVLPSRWEGLPLAILEALGTGLPVIASDIPGNKDAVTEEIDGILFSAESQVELELALEKLIKDPALRIAMGKSGRMHMVHRASIDRRVENLVALYSQALGRPNSWSQV